MPSGYTAALYEGEDISFGQFAMQCARAFGALIELRDEPLSTEVPTLKRSDYSFDWAMRAAGELAQVRTWSARTARRRAKESYESELARREENLAKQDAIRERYLRMLVHAQMWVPPTKDHEGLKEFMIDQLKQSLDFDCSTRYYDSNPVVRLTASEFQAQRIADLEDDLARSKERFADEVIRHHDRSEWVRNLVASLSA